METCGGIYVLERTLPVVGEIEDVAHHRGKPVTDAFAVEIDISVARKESASGKPEKGGLARSVLAQKQTYARADSGVYIVENRAVSVITIG